MSEETITIPVETLRYVLHDLFRAGYQHAKSGDKLDAVYLVERQIDYYKENPDVVPPEKLRDYPLDLTPITTKYFAEVRGDQSK